MSRELKFRAWDGEKMIDDVLPFRWDFVLTNMLSRCVESTGSGILGSGGKTATFEIPGYAYKEIMQFTGLKDKNGKEIYEGDIIEHTRQDKPYSKNKKTALVRCVVTWHNGVSASDNKDNPSSGNDNPHWQAEPIDKNSKETYWGWDFSEFHDCEVVGNIYQP